ncbi:MAG: sigma-70 family RNA polymerase sigma factor [Limisphaerales bacterium]
MNEPNADSADWLRAAHEQHGPALSRYAASIVGNADRARDVVQDVFLRLWREDPARLNGCLVEWLFTVCRHRALDVHRKEHRMTALTEVELDTRPDAGLAPDAQAEAGETAGRALRLLGALPENQREVVRLKFQVGLSYAEISRITGHSVSNVGFLLHTALKTLRQQMQREEK